MLYVHALCSEEQTCRFCQQTLPDWRAALEEKPKAAPIMTVTHNGEQYVLKVSTFYSLRLSISHIYCCKRLILMQSMSNKPCLLRLSLPLQVVFSPVYCKASLPSTTKRISCLSLRSIRGTLLNIYKSSFIASQPVFNLIRNIYLDVCCAVSSASAHQQ